ncbi:hypothetical protein HDU76_013272 [Blyttiomyces sp. JEL0837]|nr:hypothetical protein HDU76_013272 [Blyttiomyces sp. JEL0837]
MSLPPATTPSPTLGEITKISTPPLPTKVKSSVSSSVDPTAPARLPASRKPENGGDGKGVGYPGLAPVPTPPPILTGSRQSSSKSLGDGGPPSQRSSASHRVSIEAPPSKPSAGGRRLSATIPSGTSSNQPPSRHVDHDPEDHEDNIPLENRPSIGSKSTPTPSSSIPVSTSTPVGLHNSWIHRIGQVSTPRFAPTNTATGAAGTTSSTSSGSISASSVSESIGHSLGSVGGGVGVHTTIDGIDPSVLQFAEVVANMVVAKMEPFMLETVECLKGLDEGLNSLRLQLQGLSGSLKAPRTQGVLDSSGNTLMTDIGAKVEIKDKIAPPSGTLLGERSNWLTEKTQFQRAVIDGLPKNSVSGSSQDTNDSGELKERDTVPMDKVVHHTFMKEREAEERRLQEIKEAGNRLVTSPGVDGGGVVSGGQFKRVEPVPVRTVCVKCQGDGRVADSTDKKQKRKSSISSPTKTNTCTFCNGAGVLLNVLICSDCNGNGFNHPNSSTPGECTQGIRCQTCTECKTCRGEGKIPHPNSIVAPTSGWIPQTGLLANVMKQQRSGGGTTATSPSSSGVPEVKEKEGKQRGGTTSSGVYASPTITTTGGSNEDDDEVLLVKVKSPMGGKSDQDREKEREGEMGPTEAEQFAKVLGSSAITSVGNYTLGKTIGEGSFGKVKLGTHKLTGQEVAIKVVDKIHAPSIVREIETWRYLHHPNIAQLYEVLSTESKIYMVMELCTGGEAFDFICEHGRMDDRGSETRRIFRQVVEAVHYYDDDPNAPTPTATLPSPLGTTPEEASLVAHLEAMGMDVTGILASVHANACDQASALWYLLLSKHRSSSNSSSPMSATSSNASSQSNLSGEAAVKVMLSGGVVGGSLRTLPGTPDPDNTGVVGGGAGAAGAGGIAVSTRSVNMEQYLANARRRKSMPGDVGAFASGSVAAMSSSVVAAEGLSGVIAGGSRRGILMEVMKGGSGSSGVTGGVGSVGAGIVNGGSNSRRAPGVRFGRRAMGGDGSGTGGDSGMLRRPVAGGSCASEDVIQRRPSSQSSGARLILEESEGEDNLPPIGGYSKNNSRIGTPQSASPTPGDVSRPRSAQGQSGLSVATPTRVISHSNSVVGSERNSTSSSVSTSATVAAVSESLKKVSMEDSVGGGGGGTSSSRPSSGSWGDRSRPSTASTKGGISVHEEEDETEE